MQFSSEILNKIEKNKIISNTGCWLWTGSKNHNGYAVIRFNYKQYKVSRVIAHIHLGLNIDDRETYALHKCNNRNCINLNHIYLGTHQDNMNDIKAKIKPVKYPYDWKCKT